MSMGFLRRKSRKDRRSTMAVEGRIELLRRRMKDFVRQVKVIMQVFYEYQEIWLLTRRQLKEKRESLASAHTYLQDIHARTIQILQSYQYKEFISQEYKEIVQKTNELLSQLSQASGRINTKIQAEMEKKVNTLREQISNMEFRVPNADDLVRFDAFVRKTVVRSYEELIVKSVANRRKIKRWWIV
jgi:ElaB/YqjD/DUF883 family membrane-anchored ribosome-binding protein